MNEQEIRTLRQLMEYEVGRNSPPDGFPDLPDLPGGRYTDQRFYDLEQEHIWRKSWLLAGHIDEIPEPGCFRLWETAGQPVVIVHADGGAVNAFYNTCSHRGAPVVTDASGKRDRLVCRYHGWTYSHDGELLAVRDPQDFGDLDFSCRGLRKIRCERFGNLIFVNFDDAAPTLLEWLGPIADEWKEFQFDNCRLAARHMWPLNCNWKRQHVLPQRARPDGRARSQERKRRACEATPAGDGRDRNGGGDRQDVHPVIRHLPQLGFAAQPRGPAAAAVLAERYQQVLSGDVDAGAGLG
jgi:nitrite reductase/ring-hydroxylating ferredoxin subunit